MFSNLQDGSFMVAGYVAKDAELKKTQSGKSLAKWGVAAAKIKKDDGNYETKWTNCQAWNDAAKIAAANIKKGDTVLCIGRLETNEYEGKVYKNLVVDCFFKMPTGMGEDAPPASGTGAGISADDDLSEFEELINDDTVPF